MLEIVDDLAGTETGEEMRSKVLATRQMVERGRQEATKMHAKWLLLANSQMQLVTGIDLNTSIA